MLTETQITAKLVDAWRKQQHAKVLNLHGHEMQEAGWPDSYVVHWKWRGWIEFKGQKTTVKPLQRKVMADLLLRGETVVIIRFLSEQVYRISTAPSEENHLYVIKGTYKKAAKDILNALSVYKAMSHSKE